MEEGKKNLQLGITKSSYNICDTIFSMKFIKNINEKLSVSGAIIIASIIVSISIFLAISISARIINNRNTLLMSNSANRLLYQNNISNQQRTFPVNQNPTIVPQLPTRPSTTTIQKTVKR